MALRLASLEGQLFFEPRSKVGEGALRPRLLPCLHRQRARLADLGNQFRGELECAIVVPPDLAQIGRDHRIGDERRVGLAGGDQLTDRRVGGFPVNQGRHDGQFLCPESRRAAGHHRFLIPGQQLADRAQRRRLTQPTGQICVVFAHGEDGRQPSRPAASQRPLATPLRASAPRRVGRMSFPLPARHGPLRILSACHR